MNDTVRGVGIATVFSDGCGLSPPVISLILPHRVISTEGRNLSLHSYFVMYSFTEIINVEKKELHYSLLPPVAS
jgi:hypothetical protein